MKFLLTVLLLFSCTGAFSNDLTEALDTVRSFHPSPEETKITTFLDGGTTALTLTNKEGFTYSLCLDQQAIIHSVHEPLTEEQRNRLEKETKQKVYLGAIHPQEGGIPLEFKGEDEKALITILNSWIQASKKDEEDLLYFIRLTENPRLREIEIIDPNQSVLTIQEAARPES